MNFVELIVNKIKILKKGVNDKYFSYYSISSISKLCFAIYKFLLKLRNFLKEINESEIIEVIFDLIFIKNLDEIKISKYPSISYFINRIASNEFNINYFFQTEKLKNYVGIVYLSSLINLYLCVESPPYCGKTTSAKAIAEMREINGNRSFKNSYYIYDFHSNTNQKELYGNFKNNNGYICLIKAHLLEL